MGPILLVVFTVVAYVMVYATLPLHVRLLYVLVRPKKTVALDGSFLTLMINTTIVNLLFSLDFSLIQAPAASGALFDFYKSIGMAISKIEMIKATTLIFLGSLFHLVLACSRLTAISMPTRHVRVDLAIPLLYLLCALGADLSHLHPVASPRNDALFGA
ncbi:hypothetical protein PRIPAC_88167 [Pristionchus pacificus]|uniref:G protein-coupled receptor n=1 Tax=Pristionchus pacificus TaxID=54126 RepID=A0A2A6B8Y3_PRIPA|nr:hypothetical protein PRIPAC_88167 [Pristionchus pacificus]|eukprot:PDM62324.1 G protein-coupled receptor [Pristionchus pacificus]